MRRVCYYISRLLLLEEHVYITDSWDNAQSMLEEMEAGGNGYLYAIYEWRGKYAVTDEPEGVARYYIEGGQ